MVIHGYRPEACTMCMYEVHVIICYERLQVHLYTHVDIIPRRDICINIFCNVPYVVKIIVIPSRVTINKISCKHAMLNIL